jgi:hypothetical protein
MLANVNCGNSILAASKAIGRTFLVGLIRRRRGGCWGRRELRLIRVGFWLIRSVCGRGLVSRRCEGITDSWYYYIRMGLVE